jgi:hypothetical protein
MCANRGWCKAGRKACGFRSSACLRERLGYGPLLILLLPRLCILSCVALALSLNGRIANLVSGEQSQQ